MVQRRRVVITGLGIVSAVGVGVESFWQGLQIEPGPGPHAVEGWDPEPWIPKKEHRRLDRFSQFALVAANEAIAMAGGLAAYQHDRVAVTVGTGIGGLESLESLILASETEEPRVSPLWIPMMMCNAAAATISIKYGFRGPATSPVLACAAGAQALSDALRLVQWGYADAVVAGGAEAAIRSSTIEGFAAAKALSPTRIARPFGVDRDGFVLGEGAGLMVLEEREQALSRGAPILAELLGAASTADSHHITAPDPTGEGAERAIRLALADAAVDPSEIGYVNAHGTGTKLNDLAEGRVIARVFGPDQPAVSSIKGATGHALGASGAMEALAGVLAISRRQLPPNVGTSDFDPEIPLADVVTTARRWDPAIVMSNSFGFGGHNTVLVIGPA